MRSSLRVLLHLGVILGTVACGTAPQLDAPAAIDPAPGTQRPRPAPLVETAAPPLPVVIHRRPEPKPQPRPNHWKKIQPLYDRAVAAEGVFDFRAAEELFRGLRDDEWTPKSMRRRFQAKVNRYAEIRYRMGQVRRALDERDFTTARRRYKVLTRHYPSIPFGPFFSHDEVYKPNQGR